MNHGSDDMHTGKGSQGAQGNKPKDFKCKWSSCKGEHADKLKSKSPGLKKYPGGGKATKGGYRDAWVGAKMCPWDLDGGFKRDKLFKNGKPHYNQKDYRFQAHHLIPSTILKGK